MAVRPSVTKANPAAIEDSICLLMKDLRQRFCLVASQVRMSKTRAFVVAHALECVFGTMLPVFGHDSWLDRTPAAGAWSLAIISSSAERASASTASTGVCGRTEARGKRWKTKAWSFRYCPSDPYSAERLRTISPWEGVRYPVREGSTLSALCTCNVSPYITLG